MQEKNMKAIIIFILVFSFFSCSCQQNQNVHPFQQIENYNGDVTLPINERLMTAPQKIIGFLNDFDKVDFYSNYELLEEEKHLFMDYYNLLPTNYKGIISEKVIGIYFISNFLGGGMTLPVFDKNENMYMVIFFNPDILHQNISEWITYRDNTAFMNDNSNISLIVDCNSNYYGLIHTLLHEASHVYDHYNYITPFPVKHSKTSESEFPTEFVSGIWEEYDKAVEEYDFRYRTELSFYTQEESLTINNAFEIISSLKNTPFTSLYGSMNWEEDFAETFTWYYLNELLEINYIVNLFEDERLIYVYNFKENELVNNRYRLIKEVTQK
jgi:hypothetical protein